LTDTDARAESYERILRVSGVYFALEFDFGRSQTNFVGVFGSRY